MSKHVRHKIGDILLDFFGEQYIIVDVMRLWKRSENYTCKSLYNGATVVWSYAEVTNGKIALRKLLDKGTQ